MRASRYFRMLNYSSINEDWRTEASALVPGPADSVLCVTGSGARPLDLLALGPSLVLSVDVDPAQTALLHLKVAALRRLPFDGYARFLGLVIAGKDERLDVFESLASELPDEAASFWRRRRRDIAGGVLWAGRWERYFRLVGRAVRLLRPRAAARLFSFQEIGAQQRFVEEEWDNAAGRFLTHLALSAPAVRLLFGDPAFAAAGSGAARYVHERMSAHLGRVLARESFMTSLVIRGTLPAGDLPPHLTPSGAEVIRGRLDGLQVVTGDVVALLDTPATARKFAAYSLSDVPSYLTQAGFERLLDGVARHAAPGARFCARFFLKRPRFPERLASRLVRDEELERRLAEEDHAFAYDFVAGRVAPA